MSTVVYHGTLAYLVPSILREGLTPRGKKPSHDAYMDSASMPNFVYLTQAYDLALEHACRISERTADGADITVLSVNLRILKCPLRYPDEDYLREEWNSDFTDWELPEQLRYMEHHRADWKESLRKYHVIAYKGVIPATAISICRVPRWLEQEKRNRFRKAVTV